MLQNILILLLIVISIVMIFLGIEKEILPPVLTGIGFVIIALLFYRNNNKSH